MKRFLSPLLLAAAFIPMAGLARQYAVTDLPYSDASSWDRSTTLAVSMLTDDGVLKGNPGGLFRAGSTLNRAEFVTIVMRLMPMNSANVTFPCFPDVPAGVWYADAVCRAKAEGIVHGNPLAGIPREKWRFEPARPVQYEEALKVLYRIYALPTVEGGSRWYERYVVASEEQGIDLTGRVPGDAITRGEMARMVVAFRALSEGELDDFRAAERGEVRSSSRSSVLSSSRSSDSTSSRSSSRTSTSSRSSSRSSISSRSSSVSGQQDPLTDTSTRSNFILAGETSPVLASVSFFSNLEPVDADRIIITLASPSDAIESFRVYDDNGRYLGRATRGSNTAEYTVNLANGSLLLPRRVDTSVYVRADANDYDMAGTSGETVRVASIRVEGTGEWSNESYGQTSTDTFNSFETARAAITDILNAGAANEPLVSGSQRVIGAFRFEGREADPQADLRVTDLEFQVESAGTITLSNVTLRTDGGDTSVTCSLASNVITCPSIPASIGSLSDGPRVLKLYGTVSASGNDPSLRITLNEPGNTGEDGAVTWTDGTTTFTWVPFDAPVVRGTLYR